MLPYRERVTATSSDRELWNMTAINRVVGNEMRFDMIAGKLAELPGDLLDLVLEQVGISRAVNTLQRFIRGTLARLNVIPVPGPFSARFGQGPRATNAARRIRNATKYRRIREACRLANLNRTPHPLFGYGYNLG